MQLRMPSASFAWVPVHPLTASSWSQLGNTARGRVLVTGMHVRHFSTTVANCVTK